MPPVTYAMRALLDPMAIPSLRQSRCDFAGN
jgi:hypothetical protein